MLIESRAARAFRISAGGSPAPCKVVYPVVKREPGEHVLLVFADPQETFWGALNPSVKEVKEAALWFASSWSVEGNAPFSWTYRIYLMRPEEARKLRRELRQALEEVQGGGPAEKGRRVRQVAEELFPAIYQRSRVEGLVEVFPSP